MNKVFDNMSKKITEKVKSKNKTTVFVVIGLIGMALILLSSVFNNSNDKKKPAAQIKTMNVNTNDYKNELEGQLVDILEKIEGVGSVKVMVTIEGSTEYVYAEENDTKLDNGKDKQSQDSKNKYVIVDNGKEKEPLVKKILKPKVTGVIIVCEGGNSPIVSEKIYRAVSAVLNISSNKICVAKG